MHDNQWVGVCSIRSNLQFVNSTDKSSRDGSCRDASRDDVPPEPRRPLHLHAAPMRRVAHDVPAQEQRGRKAFVRVQARWRPKRRALASGSRNGQEFERHGLAILPQPVECRLRLHRLLSQQPRLRGGRHSLHAGLAAHYEAGMPLRVE